MKIFFDMEFTGLHQKTTPVSIGCVSECGKTFYKEFTDFDIRQVDDWQLANLFPHTKAFKNFSKWTVEDYTEMTDVIDIPGYRKVAILQEHLKEELESWLENEVGLDLVYSDDKIQFVSDCLAYDWVLLNEFWHGALNKPYWLNYIPIDICTMFEMVGIDPDINRIGYSGLNLSKHNALDDALIIKACYERLIKEHNFVNINNDNT